MYKISDDSEDLIRKLDKYKKQFPNVAFALELLYDTHGYYGFVMKYYEKIEKLSSLLLYDNIDYSIIIK